MQIYVEHHGWRYNKKQGYWGNKIHKVFKTKKSFDKYVEKIRSERPYDEITYYIYKAVDGKKGKVLAHLEYNGRQYHGTLIDKEYENFK